MSLQEQAANVEHWPSCARTSIMNESFVASNHRYMSVPQRFGRIEGLHQFVVLSNSNLHQNWPMICAATGRQKEKTTSELRENYG